MRTRYVAYEGFFGKSLLVRKPNGTTAAGRRVFRSCYSFQQDNIVLDLQRLHGGAGHNRRITIEIGGLHEGLTSIRSLTADAQVSDLRDLFFVWDAIEDVLVENSKFLTLIDIYGHYANRGDTVTIATDVIGGPANTLVRALRFFGDSANCGEAVPRAAVKASLSIGEAEVDELITELRAMRFDIRTRRTHPTIAAGMVLCTYPFPLLSDKAHLERRLKAESFDRDADLNTQRMLFE